MITLKVKNPLQSAQRRADKLNAKYGAREGSIAYHRVRKAYPNTGTCVEVNGSYYVEWCDGFTSFGRPSYQPDRCYVPLVPDTIEYLVYYNTHKYQDCSDPPRSAHRHIKAQTADEAREKVRALGKSGERHIGMIFDAEPLVDQDGLAV